MIKSLWFFIKAGLVVWGAIWLVSQPGEMNLNFVGYDVKIQTGVFLLSLSAFILVCFHLLRFVRAVFSAPKVIAKYRQDYHYKLGYHSLTRGLAAVAAGDVEKATKYSKETQKFLKDDKGLPLLLEAQAAQLRGEENASKRCFETLIEGKDTAFLGLRGLMRSALDSGDYALALDYAHKALKSNPNQPWIIKTVYELEIKNNHWENALKFGKKAQKINALPADKIISDRIAIYLMRYDYDLDQGEQKSSYRQLMQAYKLDPFFIPTVQRLAHYYVRINKTKKVISLIKAVWKENPHPALAQIWVDVYTPSKKGDDTKRLAWSEMLVTLNPDALEGHIAVAKTAMEMKYWGEAKAHLMAAEKIYPMVEVFQLRAMVEKNITHNDDQVEDVLGKISSAMPTKTWVCRETGMTYDEWSAIAVPYEKFNTIVWDIPHAWAVAGEEKGNSGLVIDAPVLLIDPV